MGIVDSGPTRYRLCSLRENVREKIVLTFDATVQQIQYQPPGCEPLDPNQFRRHSLADLAAFENAIPIGAINRRRK
jgi:hypothetical protein